MAKPEARAPARKPAEGVAPDADTGAMAKANAGSDTKSGAADKAAETSEKGDFEAAMAEGEAKAAPPESTGLTPDAPTAASSKLPGTAALTALLSAASGEAAPETAEGGEVHAETEAAPKGQQKPEITPEISLEGEAEAEAVPANPEGEGLQAKAGAQIQNAAPLVEAAEGQAAQQAQTVAQATPQAAPAPPASAPDAPAVKSAIASPDLTEKSAKSQATANADYVDPDAIDPEALAPQKETLVQTDKLPPAMPPMSSAVLDRLASAPIGGEQGTVAALSARGEPGALSAQTIAAATGLDRPPAQAQAIVAQIGVAVSKTNGDRVEVRLDPPELGRLNMIMNVSDDRAIVLVSAERQDVVDLLRRHSDLLQQTLVEAGFGDVSLEFAQSDKEAAGDQAQGGDGNDPALPGETTTAPLRVAWPGTPTQAGRLDLRL